MTYELLKNFIDSKGLKQIKIVDMLLEKYPDDNFTKNKLNNILLGKVVLTVEDFRKILTVIRDIFPDIQPNDFFDLDYYSNDEKREE